MAKRTRQEKQARYGKYETWMSDESSGRSSEEDTTSQRVVLSAADVPVPPPPPPVILPCVNCRFNPPGVYYVCFECKQAGQRVVLCADCECIPRGAYPFAPRHDVGHVLVKIRPESRDKW
jgi:hypothetical protein